MNRGLTTMNEAQYVAECPVCGVALVGMTPDEYRETHAPECNPLAELYHFSANTA
jgi:hypothetical protein